VPHQKLKIGVELNRCGKSSAPPVLKPFARPPIFNWFKWLNTAEQSLQNYPKRNVQGLTYWSYNTLSLDSNHAE